MSRAESIIQVWSKKIIYVSENAGLTTPTSFRFILFQRANFSIFYNIFEIYGPHVKDLYPFMSSQ